MKRFIVLCIIVLVSITFFSSALAEEETPFVFRNGITWGMSVEEVQEKEIMECEYVTTPEYDMLICWEASICNLDSTLGYIFKERHLTCCLYGFTTTYITSDSTFRFLHDALEAKYGSPDSFSNILFKKIADNIIGIGLVDNDSTIYQYQSNDDTSIFLIFNGSVEILYIPNDYLYSFNEI